MNNENPQEQTGFVIKHGSQSPERGLWRGVSHGLRDLSRSGYVLMVLAALGFSFKSILVKAIYDGYEQDAITIMLMRFYIGAPLFIATLLLVEGLRAFRTNPRELFFFACTGILGLGGATYFSFLAIARLGASLATLVVFTYPVITLGILGLLDRRLPVGQIFAALLALTGLAFVVQLQPFTHETAAANGRIDAMGVMYGLISALCFGSYNVAIERWGRGSSPVRQATFSITLLTLTATILFGDREYPAPAEAWALTGMLATLAGFIPFLIFLYGIRRIGAGPGTIANLMGPAFNLVWAYLFFGEVLNAPQLLGVVLVFAGVASLKGDWFTKALRSTGLLSRPSQERIEPGRSLAGK